MQLYGPVLARQQLSAKQLRVLTRDDFHAIGVPLGHAMRLSETFAGSSEEGPGDLAHAGDAYGEYAVVSALVFGFAVSTFAATPSMLADLEAPQSGIIGTFLTMLSGVTLLSAFSTVTTALQRYYCKVLLARQPAAMQRFIEQTHILSVQARRATWFALALYLASLAVLSFEIFARYERSHRTWRLVLIVTVLAVGAILVLSTYRMVSNAYEAAVSRVGGVAAMKFARVMSRKRLVHPAPLGELDPAAAKYVDG